MMEAGRIPARQIELFRRQNKNKHPNGNSKEIMNEKFNKFKEEIIKIFRIYDIIIFQ